MARGARIQPVQGFQPIGATIAPVQMRAKDSGDLAELGQRLGRFLGRDLEVEAQRVAGEATAAGRNAGLSGTLPDRSKYGNSIAEQAWLRGAEEGALNRLEVDVRATVDRFSLDHASDVEGFAKAVDGYRNGLAQGVPESLRPQFDLQFDALTRPAFNEVRRRQSAAIADERLASFEAAGQSRLSAIQRNARVAEIDPDAAKALERDIAAHIESLAALGPKGAFEFRGRRFEADPSRAGALSVRDMETRAGRLDSEATENAVLGSWSRSPKSLDWIKAFEKRELDAKTGSGLTEEQVQALAQRMRSEHAQDETLRRDAMTAARAKLGTALEDELASLRLQGKPLGLVDDAAVANAGYDLADWRQKRMGALRSYETTQRLSLASPDDVQRLRGDLAPPQGRGFADAARDAQEFEQALARRNAAIARDPAGYVVATSPSLRSAWEAADRDPRALPAAASLALDLQRQLGVPAEARAILPASRAEGLVANLMAQPPEKLADAIQGQAQAFGALWPQAYADLVRAKLPGDVQVLASMSDARGRTLLAQAFQSEQADPGALKKTAGPDAKPIADAVRQQLQPLSDTLRQAPDGAAIVERHARAAELLAYRLMQQGSNAADAAKAAANAVALERYDWAVSGNFQARLPKGEGTRLQALAADRVKGLKPDAIELPPARAGEPQSLAQRQAEYLRGLQRGGLWITGPADDRLVLLDAARQPVRLVDGAPVEILFSDRSQPQSARVPFRDRPASADRSRADGVGMGAP